MSHQRLLLECLHGLEATGSTELAVKSSSPVPGDIERAGSAAAAPRFSRCCEGNPLDWQVKTTNRRRAEESTVRLSSNGKREPRLCFRSEPRELSRVGGLAGLTW